MVQNTVLQYISCFFLHIPTISCDLKDNYLEVEIWSSCWSGWPILWSITWHVNCGGTFSYCRYKYRDLEVKICRSCWLGIFSFRVCNSPVVKILWSVSHGSRFFNQLQYDMNAYIYYVVRFYRLSFWELQCVWKYFRYSNVDCIVSFEQCCLSV
jgi:hypothetical protein